MTGPGASRGLAALLARLFGRGGGDAPAESFAWIDAPALAALLRDGRDALIIDVRGEDEFAGPLGHLAEARNIPLDRLGERRGEIAPAAGAPVVLLCRTQMRSAQAARLLADAGIRNLSVLRGGMVEWNRQGLPVACERLENGTDRTA